MLRTSNIFYKNRKQMPLQHEVYDIKGLNIVFKKGLSASMSKYSKRDQESMVPTIKTLQKSWKYNTKNYVVSYSTVLCPRWAGLRGGRGS